MEDLYYMENFKPNKTDYLYLIMDRILDTKIIGKERLKKISGTFDITLFTFFSPFLLYFLIYSYDEYKLTKDQVFLLLITLSVLSFMISKLIFHFLYKKNERYLKIIEYFQNSIEPTREKCIFFFMSYLIVFYGLPIFYMIFFIN